VDALAAEDEAASGLERDRATGIHLPANSGVGVAQFEALSVCGGQPRQDGGAFDLGGEAPFGAVLSTTAARAGARLRRCGGLGRT
jgi:hypothetical protein